MNDEWKTIYDLNRNEWRVKNHSLFKMKWMTSEKPFIILTKMNDKWKTIHYLNQNEWRVKHHLLFKPQWMTNEKPFII